MKLDNFDNNKGTPSKRTGFHNDASMDSEITPKSTDNESTEIHTPTPSNATNDIPIEVPERSAHGEK